MKEGKKYFAFLKDEDELVAGCSGFCDTYYNEDSKNKKIALLFRY